MLIHNNIPILLQHAQHFSAFSKIPGPWMDFDMDGSACCAGVGRDGLASKSDSGCCHAVFVAVNDLSGELKLERRGAQTIRACA